MNIDDLEKLFYYFLSASQRTAGSRNHQFCKLVILSVILALQISELALGVFDVAVDILTSVFLPKYLP